MQIIDATVISITGRIDEISGGQLDEYLKEQVDRGNLRLILDLKEVEFTNSGGLRILLGTIKHASNSGGEVVLANTNPMVHSILKTTGYSNLLKIFKDIDTALTSF